MPCALHDAEDFKQGAISDEVSAQYRAAGTLLKFRCAKLLADSFNLCVLEG
jgi:hypothetical protein